MIQQFRTFGGAVGLAIVIAVTNRSVASELSRVLPQAQVHQILQSTNTITTLPPNLQLGVRTVFGEKYNLQMKIMIGLAVAQIPATLLMWTKSPIMTVKKGGSE